MRVYRYEDEDGFGPFAAEGTAFDMSDAMIAAGRYRQIDQSLEGCYHSRFPPPWQDGIDRDAIVDLLDRDAARCAALDARQLVTWFPRPCREVLKRYGYRVAAYEVPDDAVLTGGSQVVFDAARATKINLPEQVDSLKLAA